MRKKFCNIINTDANLGLSQHGLPSVILALKSKNVFCRNSRKNLEEVKTYLILKGILVFIISVISHRRYISNFFRWYCYLLWLRFARKPKSALNCIVFSQKLNESGVKSSIKFILFQCLKYGLTPTDLVLLIQCFVV